MEDDEVWTDGLAQARQDGGVSAPLPVTRHLGADEGPRHVSPRKTSRGGGSVVIAVVVLAAIFGACAWLWFNRSVRVSVNGSTVQVTYHASLADAVEAAGLSPTPGNLVSVAGSLLHTGEGWPFSATVGGTAIQDDQVADYQIEGNERIEIGDGADRCEDYSTTTEEVAPKLILTGSGPVSYVAAWPRTGTRELRKGEISGETAPGDWVEEGSDLVVVRCSPTPSDGSNLVCLTFDDGPDATYTPQILDILDRYDAKATFFEIGSAVDANPGVASMVAGHGMQLGSHTYDHVALTTLDASSLRDQLTRSLSSIESATGVASTTVRPPFGYYDANTWLASGGTVSVMCTWTQDSGDWAQIGADAVASGALANVHSGSIILMQDAGGSRQQDVEALPTIIEDLQGRGYTLVTLSELLAADDSIPDDIATCSATMPEGCTWPTEVATDDEVAAWEAAQAAADGTDATDANGSTQDGSSS